MLLTVNKISFMKDRDTLQKSPHENLNRHTKNLNRQAKIKVDLDDQIYYMTKQNRVPF